MDFLIGTCHWIGTETFKLMLKKLNLGCYSLENFTGESLLCFYDLSNPKERFNTDQDFSRLLFQYGDAFKLSFIRGDNLYFLKDANDIRANQMANYFPILIKKTGANYNSGPN